MDGRGCEDYRCVEVETDVVSNTSGSARVKLVSAVATVHPCLAGGMGRTYRTSSRPLQAFATHIVQGKSKTQAKLWLGDSLDLKDSSSSQRVTFQAPALLLRESQGCTSGRGGRWSGAWLPARSEDPSRTCLQGHTDILVGVKAEMGTPKLEKPNEGYLEFFVDWSVLCRCFLKKNNLKGEDSEDEPLFSC